jgi:hypothetical protein
VHGLERLAEGEEQEEGRRPPEDGPHVRRGIVEDRGGLAQQAKQLADVPEDERQGQGQDQREDDPALQVGGDGPAVPGAVRLRDQGVERRQDSDSRHQEDDRGNVPQRAGRQGLRREMAEHDRVDDAHEHRPELYEGHGGGQPRSGGELRL